MCDDRKVKSVSFNITSNMYPCNNKVEITYNINIPFYLCFNKDSIYIIDEDSIEYSYFEENDNHKMNNKIELWKKIIEKRNKFIELNVHKIGIKRYSYYRNEIIYLENEFVSKYIINDTNE